MKFQPCQCSCLRCFQEAYNKPINLVLVVSCRCYQRCLRGLQGCKQADVRVPTSRQEMKSSPRSRTLLALSSCPPTSRAPRATRRARTPSSCCSPSSSPGSRRRRPPSGRGPASGSASGYGALHLADRPVRFPRRAGSPAGNGTARLRLRPARRRRWVRSALPLRRWRRSRCCRAWDVCEISERRRGRSGHGCRGLGAAGRREANSSSSLFRQFLIPSSYYPFQYQAQ